MGLVYEAEHLRLGRKAALKLLTPDLAADSNVRERFVQESRLIAAIDHPNIIPIYDAGEIGDTLYIAMRLVSGGDLAKLIDREGSSAVERTLALIEQAAAALDAAHARGHGAPRRQAGERPPRGSASGRAFLTDFGVAKLTGGGRETKAGMFIGSVDYALARADRRRRDRAGVDVYALGCVLFECLTGAGPYRKNTNVAILFGHLRDPPPRVTEHAPTCRRRSTTSSRPRSPRIPRRASARAGSSPPRRASASSARRAAAAATPASDHEARPPERAPPLPVPGDELVGRATELAAVRRCSPTRTCVSSRSPGPGGTGRPGLALAVRRRRRRGLPGGVILVELETLADAGLVLAAIAERLGSVRRRRREPRGAARQDGRCCSCSTTSSTCCRRRPRSAELVRPRRRRRCSSRAGRRSACAPSGSTPVPPLEPAPRSSSSPSAPAAAAGVRAERARTPTRSPEICARLDGLPLAIELAAARVRSSPAERC